MFKVSNEQISLIIGNNSKPFNFTYYYNEHTTFQDLLEFLSSLLPELYICQCYIFKSLDKNFCNNANQGFNDLTKFYIDISNDSKISQYKNHLKNLYLFNNSSECTCDSLYIKFLKNSKKQIVDYILNLETQKRKRENTIQMLEQKNSSQSNEINNLKIDKDKQDKDILELKNKINDIKSSNQVEVDRLNKKKEMLEMAINGNLTAINELKSIGYEGDNLNSKANNISVDPNSNKIIGNENGVFNTKEFIDFYDVIIDIKSIKDINKGWEVKMSKKAEEEYETYKSQEVIKVGVIGNSNKGKSFLLSRISKIHLPSGTSIRTEGLSIKYPELEEFKDRKIALLDSAGLETPVMKIKEENNKDKLTPKEYFKEKSREKIITELFLQNYIINNSDVLIIVVGILTYSEQKLINRIKNEIQRAKINKPLFIIHNLITYTSVEQVEEYIDKYLLNSATFNLEKGHHISTKIKENKGTYFYEKNSNPKIFHLIFANEGSPAGNFYNDYALEFLEKNYQNITDLKPFDVIETVKSRYIEASKDIIEKEPIQNQENKDKEKDKEKKNIFDNKNEKLIKLKDEKDIILKKCLIDELGFSNLKANGFDPTYNYYRKDNKIIVRLEAPGNCKLNSSIEYSGEYTIIKIYGNKKKDKEPEKLEDNLFNSREIGDFSVDIPLKADDFTLENKEPNIRDMKGVIILEYNLIEKNKKTEYEEEDDL